MEKWKLAVIVLLLGGLLGYGVYQQTPRPQVPIEPAGNTPPAPAPKNLTGQTLPAWEIPANLWANTPRPLTPQDLKGKVTLVEFWRAGCIHCEEAAPFMEKLYEKYSPQGLQMLTFHSPSRSSGPDTIEGNWSRVQETIKLWGITYPVAYDEGSQYFAKIGGALYPTAMLVNRDGVVEYFETGYDEAKGRTLDGHIEAMLKGKSIKADATSAAPADATPADDEHASHDDHASHAH